jgi:hypothetical protein
MTMDDKTELEKGKLLLEQKKIELEIKELERRWYKKTTFWVSAFPAILTISSLVWAFCSGLLNVKAEQLSLKKNELEFDIKRFEVQKDTLKWTIQQITNERDSLQSKLGKDIAALKNGNSKQSVYIKFLKEQNVQLQKQNTMYLRQTALTQLEVQSLQQLRHTHEIQIIDYEFKQTRLRAACFILGEENKKLKSEIKKN